MIAKSGQALVLRMCVDSTGNAGGCLPLLELAVQQIVMFVWVSFS